MVGKITVKKKKKPSTAGELADKITGSGRQLTSRNVKDEMAAEKAEISGGNAVVFRGDKSVTRVDKGEKTDLSAKEQAYLSSGRAGPGGIKITPGISKVQDIEKANLEEKEKERILGLAKKEAEYNVAVEGFKQEALATEKARIRDEEGEQPMSITETTEEPQMLEPVTSQVMEGSGQQQGLSPLDIASNIVFGDISTNPFTGEELIDSNTGKPIELVASTFPISPGGPGWATYAKLAKSQGWRDPVAAFMRGWPFGANNFKLAKGLIKTAGTILLGGAAGRYVLKTMLSDASSILSQGRTRINDLSGQIMSNERSYTGAVSEFDKTLGDIEKAERSIKIVLKTPVVKSLAGAKDTAVAFEYFNRDIPLLREELIEAEARRRTGIK